MQVQLTHEQIDEIAQLYDEKINLPRFYKWVQGCKNYAPPILVQNPPEGEPGHEPSLPLIYYKPSKNRVINFGELVYFNTVTYQNDNGDWISVWKLIDDDKHISIPNIVIPLVNLVADWDPISGPELRANKVCVLQMVQELLAADITIPDVKLV